MHGWREKCVELPINLPLVNKMIKKVSKITRKFVVMKSNKDEFEVIDYKLDSTMHYVIDLSKYACNYLG